MKTQKENNLLSEKDIREWIIENVGEEKLYGEYKNYFEGWDFVRETVRRDFNEEQKLKCNKIYTDILRQIRKEELDWKDEKINKFLLIVEDYGYPPLREEMKKAVKNETFRENKRRFLQTLLRIGNCMDKEYWIELSNNEEFVPYTFPAISDFNLRSAFELIDKINWKNEINWDKKHHRQMFHEIRGLLSNENYTENEILEEAKNSKNYLSPTSFQIVKTALPELDE